MRNGRGNAGADKLKARKAEISVNQQIVEKCIQRGRDDDEKQGRAGSFNGGEKIPQRHDPKGEGKPRQQGKRVWLRKTRRRRRLP